MLIHLGPEKTGTTSLQATLAQNADFLAQNGIYYPVYPDTELMPHHLFQSLTRPAHLIQPAWRREHESVELVEFGIQLLDHIEREYINTGFEQLLLSSELLVKHKGKKGNSLFPTFLSLLQQRIPTAPKAVFYVRHPIAHATSQFQQALRGGERRQLDDNNEQELRNIYKWFRGNMDVRAYRERTEVSSWDIVHDFWTGVLNLNPPSQENPLVLNTADPSEVTILFYACSEALANLGIGTNTDLSVEIYGNLRRLLGDRLNGAIGTRFRFSDEIQGQIAGSAIGYNYIRDEFDIEFADQRLYGPRMSPPVLDNLAVLMRHVRFDNDLLLDLAACIAELPDELSGFAAYAPSIIKRLEDMA